MKKTLFNILFTFTVLGLASGTPQNQAPKQKEKEVVSPLESYAKWRRELLGERGAGVAHYSLSLRSQRIDASTAKIDLVAVGQYPGVDLEVQPINFDVQSGFSTNDGELTKMHQAFPRKEFSLNTLAESRMIIPVGLGANALKIKWTFGNQGQAKSNTVIVALKEEASVNTFGIVPSRLRQTSRNLYQGKLSNSFAASSFKIADEDKCDYNNCPGTCLSTTGTNSTCGTFGTCCANYIDNVINGVTCIVTCGTNCSGCDSQSQ